MQRLFISWSVIFALLICGALTTGQLWAQEKSINTYVTTTDNIISTANPRLLLKTTKGDMMLELFSKAAPQAVNLFINYTQKGVFNNLAFERYAEGFTIQLAAAKKVADSPLPDERKNGLRHVKGALGLPWKYNPGTIAKKFYLCLGEAPQLDNQYTIIGQVTEGMETLMQLRPNDQLKNISVVFLPPVNSKTTSKP
jgi:cyclophilin family peptidyl-prolyl cis-trans isomerase